VHMDMIGLPGHFLLATQPQPPDGERVFVDAFHKGALLSLHQCEAIVNSYGLAWSDEMVTPVLPSEVWQRMVRNLVNCHKQVGDFERLLQCEQLLHINRPPTTIPYPQGNEDTSGADSDGMGGAQATASDRRLFLMLQSLMQNNLSLPSV